jgi:hypothetical protein
MESDSVTYFAWFLGLTVVLLVLLVYWAWRSRARVVTIDEFSGAHEALESVLLRFHAVHRIFDPNDLEFMARQSPPEIQRLFQQERKAVAISWLRHTRKQVARLVDLHLRLASYTYEPSAASEFRLEMKYLSFSLVCHLLIILVRLRGPFHARKMVGYTIGSVDRFCAVLNGRLDNINPARLSPSEASSANADAWRP